MIKKIRNMVPERYTVVCRPHPRDKGNSKQERKALENVKGVEFDSAMSLAEALTNCAAGVGK